MTNVVKSEQTGFSRVALRCSYSGKATDSNEQIDGLQKAIIVSLSSIRKNNIVNKE